MLFLSLQVSTMIFLKSTGEICIMIMCPLGCVSRCVQKGWLGDVLNMNIFKHPPKSCVKCTVRCRGHGFFQCAIPSAGKQQQQMPRIVVQLYTYQAGCWVEKMGPFKIYGESRCWCCLVLVGVGDPQIVLMVLEDLNQIKSISVD